MQYFTSPRNNFPVAGDVRQHGWLVGCLTSQQHASVSQGRICSDNFTCCHTETEAADQNFHLTQSQYADTGPTSPSADPITPGAWQCSRGSANICQWCDSTPEKSRRKRDSNPGSSALEMDSLTTWPKGRFRQQGCVQTNHFLLRRPKHHHHHNHHHHP